MFILILGFFDEFEESSSSGVSISTRTRCCSTFEFSALKVSNDDEKWNSDFNELNQQD